MKTLTQLKRGEMAPETTSLGIRQRLYLLIRENYNITHRDILKLTNVECEEYKRDLQLKKLIDE
jgi:hypothetical protein